MASVPAKSGAGDPSPLESPVMLAGFWRRIAAGLADCALIIPPLLFFLYLWNRLLWVRMPDIRLGFIDWLVQLPHIKDPMLKIGVMLAVGIAVAYVFFFTCVWNATPGQRLLKVEVVGATGRAAGWFRAALRSAMLVLSVGYLLLGVLWIAFDRLRQGWHDKLAGTYVIAAQARARPAQRAPKARMPILPPASAATRPEQPAAKPSHNPSDKPSTNPSEKPSTNPSEKPTSPRT